MFGLGLHDGWLWAIGGLVLLILEALLPGFFLMFIGGAALVTGLATVALDLGVPAQFALFVIATAVAVLLGKRWYAEPGRDNLASDLNDPARRLVGRTATVVDPVDEHGGRVRLADGEWTARGGPAAAGTVVAITGVDGNCLLVGPPVE